MRHTRGLRLVLARGACWWFENIIDRCLLWLWLISIVYEMVNILMCQFMVFNEILGTFSSD